jgi:hypothetical protein
MWGFVLKGHGNGKLANEARYVDAESDGGAL